MVDYHGYIRSKEWRSKHSEWLKRSEYRCSLLPWVKVGQVGGEYHPYNMHHLHYHTLGQERFWLDVLPLCPFAHDHIIHGLLSGWKLPRQQQHYPNTPQRIAHWWMRVHPMVKTGLCALMAVGLIKFYLEVK